MGREPGASAVRGVSPRRRPGPAPSLAVVDPRLGALLAGRSHRTAVGELPHRGGRRTGARREAADIPGCTMATQFAATINELDAADHVLLGHSMTGKVAQLLASLEGKALGPENRPPS